MPRPEIFSLKMVSDLSFGPANYDFDKKYLLNGTFRRDGFSGLSANNKYGNFGGGSIGWSIAEERFSKGRTWAVF